MTKKISITVYDVPQYRDIKKDTPSRETKGNIDINNNIAWVEIDRKTFQITLSN